MSARSGTSGLIWLAITLIAVSIATSAMGLFMDSWRTSDDDVEGKRGWGLTSTSYDCSEISDSDDKETCEAVGVILAIGYDDAVEKYGSGADMPDEGSFASSEMCDNYDEFAVALDITDDEDYKEGLDDCKDTHSAGQTGSIMLWIGFGGAIISLIMCFITALTRESGSRVSAGISALVAGLLMGAAVLTWSLMLPNGIGGEDDDWSASVNFYLTLVGAFLSLVAGIIAFVAVRRGGQNLNMPMQGASQQQYYQQQEQHQQW